MFGQVYSTDLHTEYRVDICGEPTNFGQAIRQSVTDSPNQCLPGCISAEEKEVHTTCVQCTHNVLWHRHMRTLVGQIFLRREVVCRSAGGSELQLGLQMYGVHPYRHYRSEPTAVRYDEISKRRTSAGRVSRLVYFGPWLSAGNRNRCLYVYTEYCTL